MKAPEAAVYQDILIPALLVEDTGMWCAASVREFYQRQENKLFWSSSGQLRPMADTLLHLVRAAESYGLNPPNYHAEALDSLLSDTTAQDRVPRLDILLTDAYCALFSHLRDGVLQDEMRRRDLATEINNEAITSLRRIDGNSLRASLEAREPSARQYQDLKKALHSLLPKVNSRDTVWRQRSSTLILNMERWRWVKQWPDRYVLVNIPAFMMHIVEGDSVRLQSKVIVGKRTTPTPILQSLMTSFIIYPYWHAPRSIATREILPALQADQSYLGRNNFEVLNKWGQVISADTIQWTRYSEDHFPFILRQREGSENSMGVIRFNFANGYGVYLHDTNSKRLFERERRDLSHGCVRVNNAVAFARYLVKDDDVYVTPDDLDQYLSFQQRVKINLRQPIPVKLQYFTADVLDGEVMFYDDIYNKDSLMLQSLLIAPDAIKQKAPGVALSTGVTP